MVLKETPFFIFLFLCDIAWNLYRPGPGTCIRSPFCRRACSSLMNYNNTDSEEYKFIDLKANNINLGNGLKNLQEFVPNPINHLITLLNNKMQDFKKLLKFISSTHKFTFPGQKSICSQNKGHYITPINGEESGN